MPQQATCTAELAQRLQRGDPQALRELYHEYRKPMYATALHLLGNPELATEAVQRALVQVWRAAAGFDSSRELRPWLYAIVRRTAIDVYRQQRRAGQTVPLESVPESQLARHTSTLERIWLAWQVRRALARLQPTDRAVLRLAHFECLSHTEIAETLKIPVGTVKSRIARAHRRIAALLGHLAAD